MESCCNLEHIPIAQLMEDREIMLVKLRNCDYEVGIRTEAYNFFDSLVKKYDNINFPLLILSDIVIKNISDAHVLDGVLHTLSWYDYDEIAPYGGLGILYVCAKNNAPLVQESIIFIVEDWGKSEHIDILESLKLEEEWLIKYRDDVIKKLEDKMCTEKYREDLLIIIENSYFRAGKWTKADEYFEKLRVRYGSMDTPLKLLADIVNNNISDSHVLEGVLHILSFFDYEEVEPLGITIVIACSINPALIVQDLIISCIEKWRRKEFIFVLENLRHDCLMNYRNDVIEELNSITQ